MAGLIRRGAVGAGVLATCVCTAACGSSHGASGASASDYAKQPATQIVSDVVTALNGATADHGSAMVSVDGVNLAIVYSFKRPGELDASMQMGPALSRLIALPSATYIDGNAAYWRHQAPSLSPSQASALANQWYRTSSLSPSKNGALAVVDPRRLATCLARAKSDYSVTGTATIRGQAVVVLHGSGSQPGTSAGNMYVAARAPHYPVRIVVTRAAKPGGTAPCATPRGDTETARELTFSDWNSVSITAPADSRPLP